MYIWINSTDTTRTAVFLCKNRKMKHWGDNQLTSIYWKPLKFLSSWEFQGEESSLSDPYSLYFIELIDNWPRKEYSSVNSVKLTFEQRIDKTKISVSPLTIIIIFCSYRISELKPKFLFGTHASKVHLGLLFNTS